VAVDIGVEFKFEFELEEDLDCAIVLSHAASYCCSYHRD
jgi:hypothetical protein